MKVTTLLTAFAISSFSLIALGQDFSKINKDPDVKPLSPQESHKHIKIQSPFKIDLIAAEPMVNEPIGMAWGGDGALYVIELKGYMQDADHTGAQEPVGQVARLEDTNGDGVMDKHSVFVDKLVEPRSIIAVKGGILVGAPPDIFFCKDTTGDGVADVRKSIFNGFAGRGGNVEHKTNGLMWGMDNWLYNAKSDKKYKYIQNAEGGKIIEEGTGFRGQWGITQDNLGNIYATTNSSVWDGEQIAYDYLLHNDLIHDDAFKRQTKLEKDFNTVWPIVGTPDVQGGPGIIRKENWTLHKFTAIGGQNIFRGDKLGENMIGSYIIPEPVGRLVRLSHITQDENGFRKISNPMLKDKAEFIASADPNFRPVHAYTGPDGCLYIVDMYRGIIQDGNWTRPGSYLRKEILRKGLEKNIQRGRIYRISKEGINPGAVPKFDTFSNSQLIEALDHPNGWWRDEAQKRLILGQDKSVVPALKKMLISGKTALGRSQAVWTLKGLDSWQSSLAQTALEDKAWQVHLAAIRASEDVMQTDLNFVESLSTIDISDIRIAKQLILSLGLCNSTPEVSAKIKLAASKIITKTSLAHASKEAIILSTIVSMPGQEKELLKAVFDKIGDGATNWISILSRMIVKSGDKKRVNFLLELAAQSPPKNQSLIIRGMAKALPKSGRGHGSRVNLIRFDQKPQALTAMETVKRSGPQAELFKKALTWFTWPGEPRYNKAHAVVEMASWEKNLFNRGKTIYGGLCAACHGQDGLGIEVAGQGLLAPALAGNKRLEGNSDPVIKILLHGLTGPIDGKTYSGLMAPMGTNDDEWIASVLTYVRRAWGNVGLSVAGHEVKRLREKTKDRKIPWTDKELKK